uniref:Uncharacterized protein n=1 Tax=Caenorhabditis japonica TaxID=281687 RepID=A0A8R1I8Z8_CAEJA
MRRPLGNSPPPIVNVAAPTASIIRQVSASFITAQIPIRVNGPCHALITSEDSMEMFCSAPLKQPNSGKYSLA